MENCKATTSSTHSYAYLYQLFKKRFVENYEISKFNIFLIFYPIYIKINCSVRNILLFLLNQRKPGLDFSFNIIFVTHYLDNAVRAIEPTAPRSRGQRGLRGAESEGPSGPQEPAHGG